MSSSSPLFLLLKASQASDIDRIFVDCFRYRHESGVAASKQAEWNESLGGQLSENELNEVTTAEKEQRG